jgi:hypothetical protein
MQVIKYERAKGVCYFCSNAINVVGSHYCGIDMAVICHGLMVAEAMPNGHPCVLKVVRILKPLLRALKRDLNIFIATHWILSFIIMGERLKRLVFVLQVS